MKRFAKSDLCCDLFAIELFSISNFASWRFGVLASPAPSSLHRTISCHPKIDCSSANYWSCRPCSSCASPRFLSSYSSKWSLSGHFQSPFAEFSRGLRYSCSPHPYSFRHCSIYKIQSIWIAIWRPAFAHGCCSRSKSWSQCLAVLLLPARPAQPSPYFTVAATKGLSSRIQPEYFNFLDYFAFFDWQRRPWSWHSRSSYDIYPYLF